MSTDSIEKSSAETSVALLSDWRTRAHHAFRRLWETRLMGKETAYALLAKELNLPREECFFARLSVEQCRRAVNLCLAIDARPDKKLAAQSRRRSTQRRRRLIELREEEGNDDAS